MSYASGTTVPVAQSRAEIERLLVKFGAKRFAVGWEDGAATVIFEARGRRCRFDLQIPSADDPRFNKKRTALSATVLASRARQEERRRWRALLLVIKAKIEAVQSLPKVVEEGTVPCWMPFGGMIDVSPFESFYRDVFPNGIRHLQPTVIRP